MNNRAGGLVSRAVPSRRPNTKTALAVGVAAFAVAAGYYVEDKFSHIDAVAACYVSTVLAFQGNSSESTATAKELQRNPSLRQALLRAAQELEHRVAWSLVKHRFLPTTSTTTTRNRDLNLYRLEWIKVNVRSLVAQLKDEEKLSYDDECAVLYDNQIESSYLDPTNTKTAHKKLRELLSSSGHQQQNNNAPVLSLHDRHEQFMANIMIPKQDYESVFRKLVHDVLERCQELMPELKTAVLQQQYMDDATRSVEAYVTNNDSEYPLHPRESKMVVNVARPITYVKAQQLAVHELAHHVQLVLMEDHLYPICPEMRVQVERGPMGLLLEGGAELFVELYFDHEKKGERERDLHSRLPPSVASEIPGGVDRIVAVDRVSWFGLWPTWTRIARDFGNGKISKAEARRLLWEEALKREDSWPNADFFGEVGAYSHGYGYGKELIKAYCERQAVRNKSTAMEEYIAFMKRPLTPSQLRGVVGEDTMKHREYV